VFSLINGFPPRPPRQLPTLFGRFISTTTLSDLGDVYASRVAIAFSASLLSSFPTGFAEVSRFSCTKRLGVSGVYDYAGLTADSRERPQSYGLPPNPRRQRPDCNLSKLDTSAHLYPCLRFARYLAAPNAKNSGRAPSLPLARETLAFSASCRFIPAHGFPSWRP
jgi:hypothetical protein